MTRSVYVIGAAGTGKSTFTAALLKRLGAKLGPLADIDGKPNAAGNIVTLRGHFMSNRDFHGVYLGVMRDEFPGSDGLDRASSPTGEQWLHFGDVPEVILAEGATLATRRFMSALHETTELLVLALRCDPVVHDLRLLARGAGQVTSFVRSTVTKTENLASDLVKLGATVRWVEADDPGDWEAALLQAERHISG